MCFVSIWFNVLITGFVILGGLDCVIVVDVVVVADVVVAAVVVADDAVGFVVCWCC